MENAHKTSEAQKRAALKYANSKYRPNVYLDANRKEEIENHLREKGYKSFNEYITALIDKDMEIS